MHIVLFHFYSITPNPAYENLAAALRERGHSVWVGGSTINGDLQWNDGEQTVDVLPGFGLLSKVRLSIPLITGLIRWVQSARFIIGVRKFLAQHTPDIIHVNPSFFPWLLPLIMPPKIHFIFDVKQINVGVASNLTGQVREWLNLKIWWLCARHLYDHACFHHNASAQKILGNNWFDFSTVVPVGVADEFLSSTRERSNKNKKVRFLYLGGLTKFRNLEVILLAAQDLLQETDQFQIDFYGPDKSFGYYHNLVQELKLEGVVEINFSVSYAEVPTLMAKYDVGLAYVPDRPTWHFQPTIKALEYRALGLPILSTAVESHREIVEHEENGLLVEDSVNALTAGMRRFVIDKEFLLKSMGKAQIMRTGQTWEDVAEQYESKVYNQFDSALLALEISH